jgi:hypothetical protein
MLDHVLLFSHMLSSKLLDEHTTPLPTIQIEEVVSH